MSDNPTPNPQQQVMLSLAYLAYIDETLPGHPSPDAQIKADLTAALSASAPNPIPPIAGQWQLVWGPVTYTLPGSYYQDNMMYVAKCTNPSPIAQYAVAVRGTNGKVLLDWFIDDLDVWQMMPWPYGAPLSSAVGMISESTNIGLTTLLSMRDPSGRTLFDILAAEMSAPSVTQAGVCFTGHSLGATLAATLALHARDIQSSWDPQSKATVTTINFAGPSAGDERFAAYFDHAFSYTNNALPYWTPPEGLQTYADCIRNSLDLAPMAWKSETLKWAPETYDPHFLFQPFGTGIIAILIADALKSHAYTQVQSRQKPWNGKFSDNPGPGNKWLAEVSYQHVDAYPNLLGVPELLHIFSSAVPRQAMANALTRHSLAGQTASATP